MIDARNKDDRIHRDISLDNIILVREPGNPIRRGYLIDWEVSCKVDADGRACDVAERQVLFHCGQCANHLTCLQGTWRYMSYNVLDKEDVVHSLSDDMESLLYVVLYCSLRWLPHDEDEKSLGAHLHALFDYSEFLVGRLLGGNGKYLFLSTRRYLEHITFAHPPIKEWLDTVAEYRCVRDSFNVSAIPQKVVHPKHLDAFWAEFLASHTLEAKDRIERVLPASSSLSYSNSSVRSTSSVVSSDTQDIQKVPANVMVP
ncbi:hypothetical protein A0H81_09156 [Grifola frondosa]|uniref:Fungal-type protein kinase domain-containing protein n=1 Tax=Grifola frondosa TaxID=5627 RepID=A0A1C7M262_GRIFR|nr:hypothetical protein A0H81_09156 [Grifola frondosa]